MVLSSQMDFCQMLWPVPRGGRAARTDHPGRRRGGRGGYLVLPTPRPGPKRGRTTVCGSGIPGLYPLARAIRRLIGDADTVLRMIEEASRHVPFNELFFLFGQGLLERDKCLKTLELFAEKVMPRFQD